MFAFRLTIIDCTASSTLFAMVTTKSGFVKHGQLLAWLKTKHGVTHGYANFLAHQTLQSDATSAVAHNVDLVAAQYAGGKVPLRSIYDALAGKLSKLGHPPRAPRERNERRFRAHGLATAGLLPGVTVSRREQRPRESRPSRWS